MRAWSSRRDMIQAGCDQPLPGCRLYMKGKRFFQSQHSAEANHDSRRDKSSSNIRRKRRENQLPRQRRRGLTDRVDADKQANGKVAIEQPLCAVIALCGLCAGASPHGVKENKQLREQQTRKGNMKGVILPQVTKFCWIAHKSHFFLKTAGSRHQNAPPSPTAALSLPW